MYILQTQLEHTPSYLYPIPGAHIQRGYEWMYVKDMYLVR